MTRLWVLIAILAGLANYAHGATRGRGEAGSGAGLHKLRLATLGDTTCIAPEDGKVLCWGANGFGQTGNGATSNWVSLPEQVPGISSVVSVAVGQTHSCVLLAFPGTIRCWGRNNFGQLGNGTTGNFSTTTVPVGNLDKVIAIAAGVSHTCAVKADGTARCWGSNASGQLGMGNINPVDSSPTPVPVFGLSNAIAITAGLAHTCALLAAGTVSCWGQNDFGQLGDGTNSQRSAPVGVSGLSGVVAVAAGSIHTCALLVSGIAKCWGNNGSGRLGDGTTTLRSTATTVSQLTDAVAIKAGAAHTCALRADGTARCWGSNVQGQLGDGTQNQRLTPVTVAGVTNAVELASGNSHTCALDAAGNVSCWGGNGFGQLGNGSNSSSNVAVTVTEITGNIGARGIVTGAAFTCARRGNGTAACWGRDDSGQVGNGAPLANAFSPANVSSLSNVVALAAGDNHACALRSDGTIRCWGENNFGQLGASSPTDQPTPVNPNLTGVVGIAAGFEHTCVLLHDGTARCWGNNDDGQLGDDTHTSSTIPVTVHNLTDAVSIVAGKEHTCALRANGAIRCWGENANGQLGNGTNTESTVPVAVTGLSNAVALASGSLHTCAVLANGGARCWGRNQFGQLGNSSNQDRNLPDIVSGLSDAITISAGQSHTCVVTGNGGARCWGRNADGQLAAADAADHNTPAPVIGGFHHGVPQAIGHIVAAAAGRGSDGSAHTCILLSEGVPKCWGDNFLGQLGLGNTADQTRPTTVPSFSANVVPTVTSKSNGRIAEVTALLNCEPGGHGQIFVSLTQGSVVGYGVASTNCGYGLIEVPVIVPAHGPGGFQPGAAVANLEAIVRDQGQITEHLFWTRSVVLAP